MDGLRLRGSARRAVTAADRSLSHIGARLERPSLIPLLFHSIFESDAEAAKDVVYAQEAVTRDGLRALVEDFLGRGYRFVTADDIRAGLESAYYVWLTFDDGYANNLRLPEILREYDIAATVFVATGYVETGRRFWWDTVYAERRGQGVPAERVEDELEQLKRQSLSDIESYVTREFGQAADRPHSDLDRPLTPEELRDLASAAGIEIGNHTVDHAILPLLSAEAIEEQLIGARKYLQALTGQPVASVSYPNGDYDSRVVEVARATGHEVGITTVQRKNRVPIPHEELLELGRFQLQRGAKVEAEVRVIRSELQLANAARRLRRHVGRR